MTFSIQTTPALLTLALRQIALFKKIEESLEKEYVSNCCSAPVNEDYMTCSHCYEPCDVVETE